MHKRLTEEKAPGPQAEGSHAQRLGSTADASNDGARGLMVERARLGTGWAPNTPRCLAPGAVAEPGRHQTRSHRRCDALIRATVPETHAPARLKGAAPAPHQRLGQNFHEMALTHRGGVERLSLGFDGFREFMSRLCEPAQRGADQCRLNERGGLHARRVVHVIPYAPKRL